MTIFKTIAIGSDHAGLALKQQIIEMLGDTVTWIDVGPHDTASVDYPDYANLVVAEIQTGRANAGILVCGTGIGMSIAANRHKGIRAAVCNEGTTSARLARAHNDANILCLGERLIGPEAALDTCRMFLETPADTGPRHARRVEKLG